MKTQFSIQKNLLLILICTFLFSCSNLNPSNTEDKAAKNFSQKCNKQLAKATELFHYIENLSSEKDAFVFLKHINKLDMVLDKVAGEASLYRNVHPNSNIRSAADECQQKLSSLITDISLSRPFYENLANVDTSATDKITQRYIKNMLRDFRRGGVDKDESTRARIRELRDEIIKIGQEFDSNIRQDVRHIELDSSEELSGLPEDYIAAHTQNENGKILITTDYPDYLPFMKYAHNDKHRLELYKVFRQRGFPANDSALKELLNKRYELAQVLGYQNYAKFITEDKMIKSPDNAQNFIAQINKIAKKRANEDYSILLKRLQKISPKAKTVGDWQKVYLEELIKQEQYKIDSKEIRQYFSYQNTRDGIFELAETLFGIKIQAWDTEAWHESVEAYEILDNDKLIGRFYLDMHPREGKYKHAAHFGFQAGVKDLQIPISALICNFPGGSNNPGQMEHGQVETFLHEFGHLLHSMLGSQQQWLGISGISTEWDFVEAPSQMLEEWVWDAATLQTFAVNEQGQSIPTSIIEKMNAGRYFGKGIWTRQQLFYAALSLNYYNQNPDNFDLNNLSIDLQKRYSPFSHVDGTHFYASFGHLNGYSAIYYTYMWSLVIAMDMFSEFEKYGLRNPDIAMRYREKVLAPGGSKDAAELVADFLGRPYNFKAFAKTLNQE